MAKCSEEAYRILEDVQNLLSRSLKNVTLGPDVQHEVDDLLSRIHHFRVQYAETSRAGSEYAKEPVSPPPYLDMKGGATKRVSTATDYVFSDGNHFQYELCSVESNQNQPEQNSTVTSEQEDCVYEGDRRSAISAVDTNNAVKSGFLEKKGKGRFSPFQKRWCVIREGVLYYYTKPTDKRQCGNINLTGYEARTTDNNKKGAYFEMVCPGKRTFYFLASSVSEMQEWISTIGTAAKGKPEPPPVVKIQTQQRTEDPLPPDSSMEDDIYETLEDSTGSYPHSNNANTDFPEEDDDDDPNELYDDTDSILQNIQNLVITSEQIVEVENPQQWYIGVWDCNPDEDNELCFKRGDLIQVTNKDYGSWWYGGLGSKTGYIPKNYLTEAYEILNNQETCC